MPISKDCLLMGLEYAIKMKVGQEPVSYSCGDLKVYAYRDRIYGATLRLVFDDKDVEDLVVAGDLVVSATKKEAFVYTKNGAEELVKFLENKK